MSRFPQLFSPGEFGGLTARNRLVMPPMVRNYADEHGRATPRYLAHIERIARGGVGTIILEASYVRQDGRGFSNQLGLHEDGVIPSLRNLVAAGHRHGALMGIQLFHGGRQAGKATAGGQPVAPSPIADPVTNELPRELDIEEIKALVDAFADAARRAYEAGCDFVELHGAHGYLISQFLSPYSNRRNDAYGGSPENRRRFLEEVFAAVREAVDDDFPITVRLSALENLPGGLTLDETVETARRLEALGAAAIHVSIGNYATYAQGRMIPPMAVDDGVLLPYARLVKAAVGIPVIAVGKIRSPEMAEDVIAQGDADFVAIGRSLLADPDWPLKAEAGHLDRIRPCVACNQGCIGRLFEQKDAICTVNPECGFEERFSNWKLLDAKHRLAVIGAGPAGMTAAIWAADAGFTVDLFESETRLGGQLFAASVSPYRQDWERFRAYLESEVKLRDISVHRNTRASARNVIVTLPWAAIVATGSEPVHPGLHTGPDHIPVVTGRDVLEQSASHQGHVLVAGAGCSGAQTAEYLATCGHDVTLIEATGDIGADAPIDERMLLLGRLAEKGVKVMPHTRLLGVEHEGALVQTPSKIDVLPATMVVVCLGSLSMNGLAHELKVHDIRVTVAGDAHTPRRVTEAVREGADAVVRLVNELAAERIRAV